MGELTLYNLTLLAHLLALQGAIGILTVNHHTVTNGIVTVHHGDLLSITCTHTNQLSGVTRWQVRSNTTARCTQTVLHMSTPRDRSCGLFTITVISHSPTFNSTAEATVTEELDGAVVECYSNGLLNSKVGNISINVIDGCREGDLQLRGQTENTTIIWYCFKRKWMTICQQNWNQESGRVACRQLGYSDQEPHFNLFCTERQQPSVHVQSNCSGSEKTLTECGLEEFSCDTCNKVRLKCESDCRDGEVRLMDGSTNSKGRVEVCADGHWGTVCNRSHESIAEFVCFQLGFPRGVTAAGAFPPGFVPIRNCRIQNETNIVCNQVSDTSCDHSMDLGVVCHTYEQLYNELLETYHSNANTSCSSESITDMGVVCHSYKQKYNNLLTQCANTSSENKNATQQGNIITVLIIAATCVTCVLAGLLFGMCILLLAITRKRRSPRNERTVAPIAAEPPLPKKGFNDQYYEDIHDSDAVHNPVYGDVKYDQSDENYYEVIRTLD